MARFPIQVPGDAYQGSNTSRRIQALRRNEAATILENHINSVVAASDQTHHEFLYAMLASKLNLFPEDVRALLFGQDGGHNGFSVIKE